MVTVHEHEAGAGVGLLLIDLLLEVPRYRQQWTKRVDREGPRGVVSQAAVSKVVTDYLWAAGEIADEITPRSIRHRIRRALSEAGCSTTTLQWIVAAFGMSEEDEDRLFNARSVSSSETSAGTITAFPLLPVAQHRTLSLHESHVIGIDRKPERHRTVQVVQAVTDGFQTYPYRFDTCRANVTVEDGGTPSPVVPMGGGLWGVWITLSQPLQRGQTRSLVYETHFDYEDAPAPEFKRGVRTRIDSVNLRLRFHPRAIPRRVLACTWDGDDQPATEELVPLDIERSTERFLSPMDGTVVGFRWEW